MTFLPSTAFQIKLKLLCEAYKASCDVVTLTLNSFTLPLAFYSPTITALTILNILLFLKRGELISTSESLYLLSTDHILVLPALLLIQQI